RFRERAVRTQLFRVDIEIISRKSRSAGIRRIAQAHRVEWQDLPIVKTAAQQKIAQLVRFPSEAAYAVRRRQRRNVEQHARGSVEFFHNFPSFEFCKAIYILTRARGKNKREFLCPAQG